MKVTRIWIYYDWEEISIDNFDGDVFVETDDGYTYTLSVATPKYIESLMDNEKMNYYGPGYPFILVKEFTKPIVEETIKAFAEESEGYWLKVYHFAGWLGSINETAFDHLQSEQIKKVKQLEKKNELNTENS